MPAENLKEFTINKLHIDGYGIPENTEKKMKIWNVLPNETVSICLGKKKRRLKDFIPEEIIKKSKFRIEPLEPDHFLSCSPWQIIDWEEENRIKQELIKNLFKESEIKYDLKKRIEITKPKKQIEYRNKIEYSFYIDDEDKIHLAFHKRGSKGINPIDECKLASSAINETAKRIINWINEEKISKSLLKTLIIRSNQKGETIAGLFIKENTKFTNYPKIESNFKGFTIYTSNPKCPASIADEAIYKDGENWLEEKINIENNNFEKLKYGILSFFQVNIPIFEKALAKIHQEISNDKDVLDFYSGVGSISLPIANKCKSLTLVDNNEESIEFAKLNIKENNISNAQEICLPAEKITELIAHDKIVIVDPPRSGIHHNVVEKLLQETPEKIIYLSCNPKTQVTDLVKLQGKYHIKSIQLYNFFPRTPHIESLVILDRI